MQTLPPPPIKIMFKIVYLGGKQAGLIGLLTAVSFGCEVKAVVPRDSIVGDMARKLKYPIYDSVKQEEVKDILYGVDLLISVHSKELVPAEILNITGLGGINVHPCLYKYKGLHPISRFLAGDTSSASVGVHYMVEAVDCGEVIRGIFVDINKSKTNTVAEVYNILYPIYATVLFEALEILEGR